MPPKGNFDRGQGGDHYGSEFLEELYGHSLIAPHSLLLLISA